MGFSIGSRHVGDGAPCLIVGEVAQAHEGSLSLAHAYIDAIADAGADAVKFQIHDAEHESTLDEPWRVPPRWPQDRSRFDYWKRMQFTPAQWMVLSGHARERDLAFIASAFCPEVVCWADPIVDAWKVASGEVHPGPMFDDLATLNRHGKPVIVSHGMSTQAEADWSTGFYPVALLQCTSMYPCPPDKVGLSVLTDWRKRYGCPVGLSDHSGTIYAGLAAVALGCDVLEVHVIFNKDMGGFDASSSITIQDLGRLVYGARFIEKAKQPVDKDALAKELEPMRRLFMDKHKRKATGCGCGFGSGAHSCA
jgi:N-acetylneuraminate synthase